MDVSKICLDPGFGQMFVAWLGFGLLLTIGMLYQTARAEDERREAEEKKNKWGKKK